MSTIHLMLQGKGGVSKTFISSMLAQFYAAQNIPTVNVDTDPVNQSFSSYKALNVQALHLMEDSKIKPLLIDKLVEQILEAEDTTFIIDNGASSFLPMNNYILATGVFDIFQEAGHKIIIHTVLAGGTSFDPTMDGLAALCQNYPDITKIVWINEFFGEFSDNGRTFEKSKIYKDNVDTIQALIKIPRFDPDLMEPVLTRILKDQKTFEEARHDPEISVMDRSRLNRMWGAIQTLMSQAQIG